MENKDLFRKEALEAKIASRSLHGEVLLYLPSSYRAMLAVVLVALGLLIAVVLLGSYTKRVAVKGELFSTTGTVPVYLARAGVITRHYVNEDDVVQTGEPLFDVSTEVFGAGSRGTSAETLGMLSERKSLLSRQLESEGGAHEQYLRSLAEQVASKQNEKQLIKDQLKDIATKNRLLSESLRKYEEARMQEAISDDAMAEKTITALNSQIDHNERQRQLEAVVRDIANLAYERKKAISEFGKLTLQIQGELLALEEQIIAVESQQGVVVKSPAAGAITAIQAVAGSYHDGTKPIAFVVPAESHLEARLLVPAAAIGFIKKGDIVHLRYSAYPYQKFGQGKGVVYTISGTSLLPNEIALGAKLTAAQPMYLVKVKLDAQTISGEGATFTLRPGLVLDADVMLERNRIYQWLLRPFFALSENLN